VHWLTSLLSLLSFLFLLLQPGSLLRLLSRVLLEAPLFD
jgi:hypothetical protein